MTEAKKLFEDFTTKLEARRVQLDWTVKELSEKADTSVSQVSRLLGRGSGEMRYPTLETMARIADALGLELEIVLKEKKGVVN